MKLSAHFTLYEATFSTTAITNELDNSASPEEIETLKYTAAQMEKVRKLLGNRPIHINSWFRSEKVNHYVGGVPTSQHRKGEAVDFRCPKFGSPRAVCLELMKHKETLGYDQIILEPTWVHISFTSGHPRKQALTYTGPGKYSAGIS